MRKIGFTLVIWVFAVCALFGQASIEGIVTDRETGEPIIFGDVALLQGDDDVIITGSNTDINGYFVISGIRPGSYTVEYSYLGYQTVRLEDVVVSEGSSKKLDATLAAGIALDVVEVVFHKELFDVSQTSPGAVVSAEKIKNNPNRNINSIAATSAGVSAIDGGALSIRGSRSNATNIYVDGMRVSSNLVPDSEIEQLQVITGGLQARYGDVTGGVVSITTKGPARKFRGSVEAETSNYLDPFDRTLARASVSGPILKSKKDTNQTVLGYRLSGQYINQVYPYTYRGAYVFPEETVGIIEANPVQITPQGLPGNARSELYDNAVLTQEIPNEKNTTITGTAKIDVRFSDAIDMSFTGSYNQRDYNFTTRRDQAVINTNTWRLLNYMNNPVGDEKGLRASVQFRHKLSSNAANTGLSEEGDEVPKQAFIQNASYTIRAGYEKENDLYQDSRHEDNLFRYGHVGTFEHQTRNSIGIVNGQFAHVDFRDTIVSYTPSEYNPVYSNYNQVNGEGFFNEIFDPISQSLVSTRFYNARNGLISAGDDAWGFYSNVGQVYDRYRKLENERYTVNVESSFDLFPGGTTSGRHNIEFGFLYEERVNRDYNVAPFALWQNAQSLVNANHIGNGAIDTTDILSQEIRFNNFTQQFDTFNIYNTQLVETGADDMFWRTYREKFGIDAHEIVNVENVSPDDLDFSMFSAQEILGTFRVGLYGFDYLGNKTGSDATFEGFFKDVNQDGTRSFLSPADRPVYTAAYIQDKFSFKDLYFTVGLRVDRYDANTKVLRDKYSLFEIQDAETFYNEQSEVARPENIDPSWKVYTVSQFSTTVTAYRDGDQWYAPDGTPQNDPSDIFGGGVANPKYTTAGEDIQDVNYDLDKSFKDYEPELNWMPRIAFSFPLSDRAGFFAHYDILYQRPPERNFISPLTYYNLSTTNFDRNAPLSNPDLRSEKTTDFEVGFQQQISSNSALRMSLYYKEQSDLIQARRYQFTSGIGNTTDYSGFDNIDFSTTKGIAFRYDLRRVKQLEAYITYNLQFAEGTGSSVTSQIDFNTGNQVREIFPLSFDERHQLNVSLDYRYRGGSKYTGPTIAGKKIFANTGVNLLTSAVSGRPFTQQDVPAQFGGSGLTGGFNESRYPWRFNMDLQVDKSFTLVKGKAGKGGINANVYVRALNLLNTENIIGWYRASLSTEDDGFLNTPQGISQLAGQTDQQGYLQARQWRLLNNGFYTRPRRVFVGAYLTF